MISCKTRQDKPRQNPRREELRAEWGNELGSCGWCRHMTKGDPLRNVTTFGFRFMVTKPHETEPLSFLDPVPRPGTQCFHSLSPCRCPFNTALSFQHFPTTFFTLYHFSFVFPTHIVLETRNQV